MSHPIDLMRESGLLDWVCLLVGFERGWARRSDVIAYAVQWLLDHPGETDHRVALMAGGECYDDDRLQGMLRDYLDVPLPQVAIEFAIDKWRFAHLVELSHRPIADDSIDDLAVLNATIGFPAEMPQPPWQSESCALSALQDAIEALKVRFGIAGAS